MIHGTPGIDDLVALTRGGRESVTIYHPLTPPRQYRRRGWLRRELAGSLTTAVGRLVGRGAGHDAHWAIRRQFDGLIAGAWPTGQSVALFLTEESAVGFGLPIRVEPDVRVGDYFDLGPLVRAVTGPQRAYGVTVTPYNWGLWEAAGAEPARLVAGATPDPAAAEGGPGLPAATARLWLAVTSRFRSRAGTVRRSLERVRDRLQALDPEGSALLVLFTDDAVADWRAGVLEEVRLGRPLEVAPTDAEGLTPGRIGRELRRRQRRYRQQALSQRIALLRAEHADGYPSTDLAQIALAAAAGRVRTFVYDVASVEYGRLDADGRFEPDQWGYDVLARIAIDVLAGGGEAFAVASDDLLSGAMPTPVLAEIAYQPPPDSR